MKINRKLEIGINAVAFLKSRTGPTRVTDMASEVGTTVNFLEQVMRKLKAADLVTVKRGPGGGYTLNTCLNKTITAYDVAVAVGREFGELRFDSTPKATQVLSKNIADAFENTVI